LSVSFTSHSGVSSGSETSQPVAGQFVG
jgi:hypothetical protein